MTQVLLRKEMGGARPASDDAYRVLGAIKEGTVFVADIRDPSRRSGAQHRFWFSMVNLMFESQDYYKTLDHYRHGLLIRMGYCDTYKHKDGTSVPIAHSLAFGKMPQDEFNGLVEDTLNIAEHMGFNRDDLLRYTRERAGQDYSAHA